MTEVHDALNEFMQNKDFLEGKRIVERLQRVLLSDECFEYLGRQLAHAGEDSALGQVLALKTKVLIACRTHSIGYAFAQMFLKLYPHEASEEVAQRLAGARSPEEAANLAKQQPDMFADIQRIVVAAQLQSALYAEIQADSFPLGDVRRVEACRIMLRLSDKRVDPDVWLQALGELAHALVNQEGLKPESLEEAAGYYREGLLLCSQAQRFDLTAQLHRSLAYILHRYASVDGQAALEESIEHLNQAAHLQPRASHPQQWAQTQHAMAEVLLDWQGEDRVTRIQQAVTCLLSSLAVYEQDESAESVYLAVHQQLESAYRVLAQEGVNHERRKAYVIPRFHDGETWQLSQRSEVPGYIVENWLCEGESLSLCSQLVTIETHLCAQDMPFKGIGLARKKRISDQVVNGVSDWHVLRENDQQYVYSWSLSGDLLNDDKSGITRMFRGEHALYLCLYTRWGGPLSQAEQQYWLGCLDTLSPAYVDQPDISTLREVPMSEIEARLQWLAAMPKAPVIDAKVFCDEVLKGVSRSTYPQVWGLMMNLCALYLLRASPESPAILNQAKSVLRRSLEVFSSGCESWARAVVSLARVMVCEARTQASGDMRGLERVMQTAVSSFAEKDNQIELGAAIKVLADVKQLGAADVLGLQDTLAYYQQALEYQTLDKDILQWGENVLALADTRLQLSKKQGEAVEREQARIAYVEVLSAFADDSRLLYGELNMEAVRLLYWANTRLAWLEREDVPPLPKQEEIAQSKTRGRVLYLRPFLSGGALMLANRSEPESRVLPCDLVLYRAMAEVFSFNVEVEGLDDASLLMVGGHTWKEYVVEQLEGADCIIVVPHCSTGLRWQIETIKARGLLPCTLFMMPPLSSSLDVEAMWQSACELMRELGLETPDWHEEGLFFRFNFKGEVDASIPFSAVWDGLLCQRLQILMPGSVDNSN